MVVLLPSSLLFYLSCPRRGRWKACKKDTIFFSDGSFLWSRRWRFFGGYLGHDACQDNAVWKWNIWILLTRGHQHDLSREHRWRILFRHFDPQKMQWRFWSQLHPLWYYDCRRHIWEWCLSHRNLQWLVHKQFDQHFHHSFTNCHSDPNVSSSN